MNSVEHIFELISSLTCKPTVKIGRAARLLSPPLGQFPLPGIAGQVARPPELGLRLGRAPELHQQVAAHARQQVVSAQRRLGRHLVDQSQPGLGPNAIPTATARLSSTIGDGMTSASTPYSSVI